MYMYMYIRVKVTENFELVDQDDRNDQSSCKYNDICSHNQLSIL